MTITYLGWYRVVLTQPPDPRVGTVMLPPYRHKPLQTLHLGCLAVVRSISRPYDVVRGGS